MKGWYLACRECSVSGRFTVVQPLFISPISCFLDFKLRTVTHLLKDGVE